MELFEAIKMRRSIRKYKQDPVDDKLIEQVLEAARQAPSWANTQCWKFIVVKDAEKRAKIAGTLQENPNLGRNPASISVVDAPVLIVALAEKGVSGTFQSKPYTYKGEWWFMFDVALAMANLTLAATALGLGTVHIGLFDADKAAEILGIPDNYYIVEMMPLGYPQFWPNARPRKELSELVYKDEFGINYYEQPANGTT
jgi:nitroreductase